jgi:acyl-CoA reductase-like NAD-dependent aldehyde dehydrogenase
MTIDGQPVTADDVIEVRSPFDDRLVGIVPAGTTDHLDTAVAVARATHAGGVLPAHRRARILDQAADAIERRAEEFAGLISAESAKPITTARTEVSRAVDTFRFSAAVARTATGDMVPLDASAAGEHKLGFTLRLPVGVVAAISPFNFPLNLVAHKVAPAIAAGCPVVLKPASTTPLTALALANLLIDECGLPPQWLSVVTCSGSTASHLVTHPDVAMVTFTGSPAVGWSLRQAAPRKRVSLELGNNAPVIIEPDTDIADVARRVAAAGYGFAGQSCISVQRVYVHHDIAYAFAEALASEVAALVVGDPADDATNVSALISPGETERVVAAVNAAVADGATAVAGGNVRRLGAHGVLEPTVLTGVTSAMAVSATEIFGPVVGIAGYATIDDAITMANDTVYGLQAGIFTTDLSTALHAAHRLNFGGVMVNEVPTWRADQMPYGGVGESGNTREGPAWTVREMTVERMVAIDF